MSASRIRPSRNKSRRPYLPLIGLLFAACSSLPYRSGEGLQQPRTQPIFEEFTGVHQSCRGKGYLVSSGEQPGRLNFSFTSNGDSTYIQFVDLLGRRTLFLTILREDILAWDRMQNRKYDRAALLISFPFLEVVGPQDLNQLLWGLIPEKFITPPGEDESGFEDLSAAVGFYSDPTAVGPLVSKVVFRTGPEQVELNILERELGTQYPHLVHQIPTTIPVVNPQ